MLALQNALRTLSSASTIRSAPNVITRTSFFKLSPIAVSTQDRLFATKTKSKLPLLKPVDKPKSKYDTLLRKSIQQKRSTRKKTASSKPAQTGKVVSKSKPITISPSGTEKSIFGTSSFADLKLRTEILEALKANNIEVPTWIQQAVIPEILSQKTGALLFADQTGTGKTLAYLLPMMQKLKEDEEKGVETIAGRPRGIIILPNRELAQQVLGVAKTISHHLKMRCRIVSGGEGKKAQAKNILSEPVDILVATPGRILQHNSTDSVYFSKTRLVVFDEADTLLVKDFKDDLDNIMLPLKKRSEKGDHVQFIFTGATMTKQLETFVKQEFPNVKQITSPKLHKIASHLKQQFIRTDDRKNKLMEILTDVTARKKRVIVFCNTIPSCRAVDHFLRENNFQTSCFHGDIRHKQRRAYFQEFVEGKTSILIATDIGSRGLDTINVDHVINFDFPLSITDYIHRIGRTARAGRSGAVTSLLRKRDEVLANNIIKAVSANDTLAGLSSVKGTFKTE